MKVIATHMPRFTTTLWRRQAEAAKLDAARDLMAALAWLASFG